VPPSIRLNEAASHAPIAGIECHPILIYDPITKKTHEELIALGNVKRRSRSDETRVDWVGEVNPAITMCKANDDEIRNEDARIYCGSVALSIELVLLNDRRCG
jgi:hypothetical protein